MESVKQKRGWGDLKIHPKYKSKGNRTVIIFEEGGQKTILDQVLFYGSRYNPPKRYLLTFMR